MSFILDALRKSEIERQRQSGPSMAEFPVAREDRRLPIALIAIGFLAKQVGLGSVPEKIAELIGRLREIIDEAIDWLIEQALRPRPVGDPWVCPGCGEHMDAQFSECWRCAGEQLAPGAGSP